MNERGLDISAAVILAVQAVVVAVLLAGGTAVMLPVTAQIGGGILIAMVDVGSAAVILLAFAAACRVAAIAWGSPVVRWIEWSQVSAITVFLVAQLNGVQDIAALVALYALTAGASLFLILHEATPQGGWPYRFGAAVGIVPWGVIAFYQIAGMLSGSGPDIVVRIITVSMLVLAGLYWVFMLRTRSSYRVHQVLTLASTAIFAWMILVLSLPHSQG